MFPLNLDDDDQLLIQNMKEDEKAGETAELLKYLFSNFSYVKRKPKKEYNCMSCSCFYLSWGRIS